jgi:HD-GYP domain-containing protein (c-di-GMP phosphodiesterase class II)
MSVPGDINNTPLYNSRIIDTYIKLTKRKYSHVNISDVLNYANMTSYEVADEGHWFSQEQITRFHEKLSEVTNNPFIAREAGRYAVSPDAMGAMRPYVLGMVDTATVYGLIGKTVGNFTKSARYESKKLASNKVEITVTPREKVCEKPFQCENRIGFFEAIALAFTNKLPQIEHPECIFKGKKSCVYIISWEKSSAAIWKNLRNYSALFLPLTCLIFSLNHPFIAFTFLLPTTLIILLLLSLVVVKLEKKELKTSLSHLKNSTDTLIEQININYNNALMTNEIGQAISNQTNINDILLNVVQIFKKRLDYDRCMILLADPQKKWLHFWAGFGFTEDQQKFLKEAAFHLDRPKSKGIFVVAFREQKSFLINDINEIETDLSIRSLALANKLGSQSFICCPIICDRESLGILAVDNLRSKQPLVQSDISLLMGIASVLGVSIRNADLHEAREKQFKSILLALAASIDARDPMTSGHSERVTQYAIGISNELGLSQDFCKMVQVAALLHDYGKIGIPDAILKKPGRLTEQEYEIVKNHSYKTKRILEQINFEGIFSQVPEITGAHHENFNGTGYPNGLKGEEIPLGARIIGVADFFEAVTARRHYRDPMSLSQAFMLLKDEIGKRFEGEIVEAFLRYYSKTHAGEPEYRISMM